MYVQKCMFFFRGLEKCMFFFGCMSKMYVQNVCFFEKNVRATDGETNIFAKNLDLLATESVVQIYNNVELMYPTGSLKADKIDYNFETKNFKVSMFNDQQIKMKVVK